MSGLADDKILIKLLWAFIGFISFIVKLFQK